MGWYDDEEAKAWLPQWAIAPLMWIGCVLVAAVPAGMTLGLWGAVAPQAPPLVSVLVYACWTGAMIAAVRPWTIR